MGFILSEERLDGKGHLDLDFYINRFEQIFDKNNSSIVLYKNNNRKIGKSYVLNEFAYICQFTHPQCLIFWVSDHINQERIGDVTLDYKTFYFIENCTGYTNENSIFILDGADAYHKNIIEFLCWAEPRKIKVVGFVE